MININHLSYKVGQQLILDDINTSFKENEVYGIIGPNGAGKSTLLKHMMRLIEPPKSTIFYKEKDVKTFRVKDYARKASFVFQESTRDVDFTVHETLLMGRYTAMDLWGNIKKEDENLVKEIMKDLKLEHLKERSIRTLSGGEAQKVFIGRALVQGTPLLLLDEPTSMLDIHNGVELLQLIKAMKEKHHLTIVMVLHDLNLAFNVCSQILLMNQGKVVLSDTPQKVMQNQMLQTVYKDKICIIEDKAQWFIVPRIEG